ncbi:hypothetical protein VTP01DRAFT_2163 [Rhizomucor pusillus]|uniref:uncharacterized protein n=1 Tax=Rhizomucor pusillus TaxID=4840 RepID=UPI00374261DF
MTSTALYNGPGLSGWQDRRLLGPTAPAAGTLVVPEVFAAAPVSMSLQSQDPDELAHSSVLKDISKESLNLCKCIRIASGII